LKPAFFQITLKLFLLDSSGKLLILRDRASGLGDLPGGRLGKGEIYTAWTQTIQREIREELGSQMSYSVRENPIFCFPHFMLSDQCEGLGIAFQGIYEGGELHLSDEHDYHEWADLKKYNFENLFKDHMLEAVLKFIQIRETGYDK